MKQYKQQLIGVIIGIILTLISIAIRPEYIDYTDRAKVVKWLTKFQNSDTAKIIEKDLLSTQHTVAKNFKLDDTNVEMGYVNSLGQVFLKSTGKGYILILIPQKINNKIEWQCFGGNNNAMPIACRNDFSAISNP